MAGSGEREVGASQSANISASLALCAVLALYALLALSACGSAGGAAKSAYVAKANATCRSASSQTAPLIAQVTSFAGSVSSGGSGADRQLASTLARLHAVAAQYLAQLRRLKQPSGEHSRIEAFLTPLTRVVDAIGKAATAVGGGRLPTALSLLQEAGPVAQDATAAAHAYGMRECETILTALG